MSATRVAAITGSAQGIGRSIALRLAKDGLSVVVTDVPAKAALLDDLVLEIRKEGGRATAVVGDVTIEADVQKIVNSAVAEFGGLDVMVANAGLGRLCPLTSTSMEEWNRILSINAGGVFLCYKTAAAHMIKQGRGGRLIGACSLAGKIGGSGAAAYTASKFAVRGLTQSAAAELRPYKITVNAYAPGAVETPMLVDLADSLKEHGLENESKRIAAMETGAPEEVAALVSYMASEESRWVTGQTWNISGGAHFD